MLTLQELAVINSVRKTAARSPAGDYRQHKVLLGGENGYRVTFEWATRTLGGGEPHNNMPPYLARNYASWCEPCKARTLTVLIFSAGLQVAASSVSSTSK